MLHEKNDEKQTMTNFFEKDNQTNANNVLASNAITIDSKPADLVVKSVTLPATSQAGKTALVSWQVSNQGTGDSIVNGWDDVIIASFDGIIGNADDVLLGTFTHQGLLKPGLCHVGL